MTTYTTIVNPNPERTEYRDRHKDPMLQWKFEAQTVVDRADTEKGRAVGYIHFPDDSLVRFSTR